MSLETFAVLCGMILVIEIAIIAVMHILYD